MAVLESATGGGSTIEVLYDETSGRIQGFSWSIQHGQAGKLVVKLNDNVILSRVLADGDGLHTLLQTVQAVNTTDEWGTYVDTPPGFSWEFQTHKFSITT